VLDFSRYRAGPTTAQIMADMGADVIRVERPGGEGDRKLGPYTSKGESFYLMITCRNKKDITLNLATEGGNNILKELVKKADVVVESFGPGVNRKLGLDYDSLKAEKSDIIVVAVSAFGQDGPYAKRLAFDAIAQAMSGLMAVTGLTDSAPLKHGANFIDTATGVYGALGAMFALYHREKTGEGQMVDVALLDTAVSYTESFAGEYREAGKIRPRLGNAHYYVGPYDAYKAEDGYFYLAVIGEAIWRRFCRFMGREELTHDPKFSSDSKRSLPDNQVFFSKWLNDWAQDKKVAEIVIMFNDAGVPCSPVNTIPQAVDDPQIKHREMLVELDHPGIGTIPIPGIPFKLSLTPGLVRTARPFLGEHNNDVYQSLLGYDKAKIDRLKKQGII
ncbi:CaiB/BaiF CoA transferase family protein, partial [Chloroflexota bacterium]